MVYLLKQHRLLSAIVALALLLRLLFLLFGAPVFYHSPDKFYFNGDSASYTQAFENLWQAGQYTFDFQEPDAAFGRLPGYPFFYGAVRLLVGPELAPVAVATVQILLDSGAVLLVYGCLRQMVPASTGVALLGAFLYAVYPFIIVWVPIIGTESLSANLTMLWLYLLVRWRPTVRHALGLGLVLALNLLVREYMGALLPATLVYVGLRELPGNWRLGLKSLGAVGLGFLLLYGWWPVRNYYSFQRVVLLKPRTAGYANFTAEVAAYNAWVHCWSNNENPWLDSLLVGSARIRFPAGVFPATTDSLLTHELVRQVRRCGSGYYVQRRIFLGNPIKYNHPAGQAHPDTVYQRVRANNCNDVTAAGFTALRARFAEAYPVRFWLCVPLQNLRKTFFKSSTNATHSGGQATLQHVLFAYRSVLLLLGWAGLVFFVRRYPALLAVGGFALIIYGYMWFVIRGVEMRYLLQTDILLLIPASLLLHHLAVVFKRRTGPAAAG